MGFSELVVSEINGAQKYELREDTEMAKIIRYRWEVVEFDRKGLCLDLRGIL